MRAHLWILLVVLPALPTTGAQAQRCQPSDVRPETRFCVDAVASPTQDASAVVRGYTSVAGGFIRITGGSGVVTTVSGTDRRFEVEVPLHLNRRNILFVVESDRTGGEAQTDGTFTESSPIALEVVQDRTPPEVFIDFPANAATVTSETVDVAGRVGDLLSGFMGLEVTVVADDQRVPAVVDIGIGTNGTFFASGIRLRESGRTLIRAVAADALGNERTAQIIVERGELTGASMIVRQGASQTGPVGEVLPEPIVVEVTDADGMPFRNKVVTFNVARSNGLLLGSLDDKGGSRMLQVRTNGSGLAGAYWRLGSDAGCGNNRIAVTSNGISGNVAFCASGMAAEPRQINLASMANRRGESGSIQPEPLSVWVNDSCNGVAGVPVTFVVERGSGLVNGRSTVTVRTGATGHASVEWRLGPDAGANIVTVDFPGNLGLPARFVARAVDRRPGGRTTFRALVLDNARRPIGGAVCRLENGLEQVEFESDVDGSAIFDLVPFAGPAKCHVEGEDATSVDGEPIEMGSFPALTFEVVLVPSGDNELPMPVLLPPLEPENVRSYSAGSDTLLGVAGIEGLQMLVKAGSMQLDGMPAPDGTPITLNQVHIDDIPMPMPNGAAPLFAWTLQPSGATFDPPIAIRYPNMSGLPPGAISYFLNFDHDVERFEIVASGSVSTDGASIVTDLGTGLRKAGWGGACPPYTVTGDVCGCRLEDCDEGELSGGETEVDKTFSCAGEDVTFRAFGVEDSGGRIVKICDSPRCPGGEREVPPAPVQYGYILQKDGVRFMTGFGESVTVTTTTSGLYECTFVAFVDRACAPDQRVLTRRASLAEETNIFDLTVAKHQDMASDGNAGQKLRGASGLLVEDDRTCSDVKCCVSLVQDGETTEFGENPGEVRVIMNRAELLAVLAVPANIKVVDLINFCSGPPSMGRRIIGCTATGMRNMILTKDADAQAYAHEFGHAQGLHHDESCPTRLMQAIGSPGNRSVTAEQRTAFRSAPDRSSDDE